MNPRGKSFIQAYRERDQKRMRDLILDQITEERMTDVARRRRENRVLIFVMVLFAAALVLSHFIETLS